MAFTDEYPYLNNTTSYIIDEDVEVPPVPPNPNSIILLGTAEKGPLYKPIRMDDTNLSATFGDYVDDGYGDLMLIKGYKEIRSMFPGAYIYGVRIGNATRASLDLYEAQVYTSGDLTATDTTVALNVQSKTDGENDTEIIITGDESGHPTSMDVELPNGVTLNYQLDMFGAVPGAYYKVSDLADALNNDTNFATYNVATATQLVDQVDITITESSTVSGEIETTYDIESAAGKSYGDKMIDVVEAYNASVVTDSTSIEAGDTSSTLTYSPNKDSDPNTETISVLSTIKTNEEVISAAAGDIGTLSLTLDCAADSHWDKTDTTYNITDLTLTLSRSGTAYTLVEGTDYSIVKTTGVITLLTGASSKFKAAGAYGTGVRLGDKVYADYKYKTIYVEANVRSDLQTGNRYSYFIYGSQIIFGAAQLYALEARYSANNPYVLGVDMIISDADDAIIRFVNPDNYPSIGDTVRITVAFEAELPATTGTLITTTIVQQSQLTGGSTGRRLIGDTLYNELEKGYQGAENIPGRYIIPLGVYLDNTKSDVDYETGLPTTVNAGYLDQLSRYAKRKSRYVSECFGIICPQAIAASDINSPTLAEQNTWYASLTTVSATDTTRPANVLASFDDYHIVVPVGDAVFQINGIKSGRPYVGQFAAIHAAIMQNMNRDTAIVNMNIAPGPIQRFIYPVMSNEKINRINQYRYTLYTQSSVDGAYTIVDSPTLARAASKFDRQFVTQTVFDIIQTARQVAKPFFGQPGFDSVRKSLEQSITNSVNELYFPNRVSGFKCEVFATTADKLSGKTQVLLQIVTSKEIRKIAFTTQLELV